MPPAASFELVFPSLSFTRKVRRPQTSLPQQLGVSEDQEWTSLKMMEKLTDSKLTDITKNIWILIQATELNRDEDSFGKRESEVDRDFSRAIVNNFALTSHECTWWRQKYQRRSYTNTFSMLFNLLICFQSAVLPPSFRSMARGIVQEGIIFFHIEFRPP